MLECDEGGRDEQTDGKQKQRMKFCCSDCQQIASLYKRMIQRRNRRFSDEEEDEQQVEVDEVG